MDLVELGRFVNLLTCTQPNPFLKKNKKLITQPNPTLKIDPTYWVGFNWVDFVKIYFTYFEVPTKHANPFENALCA